MHCHLAQAVFRSGWLILFCFVLFSSEVLVHMPPWLLNSLSCAGCAPSLAFSFLLPFPCLPSLFHPPLTYTSLFPLFAPPLVSFVSANCWPVLCTRWPRLSCLGSSKNSFPQYLSKCLHKSRFIKASACESYLSETGVGCLARSVQRRSNVRVEEKWLDTSGCGPMFLDLPNLIVNYNTIVGMASRISAILETSTGIVGACPIMWQVNKIASSCPHYCGMCSSMRCGYPTFSQCSHIGKSGLTIWRHFSQ